MEFFHVLLFLFFALKSGISRSLHSQNVKKTSKYMPIGTCVIGKTFI